MKRLLDEVKVVQVVHPTSVMLGTPATGFLAVYYVLPPHALCCPT